MLLRPGKALALVIYLRCSPRRSASRDHLVNLLWADHDPDTARPALRQTIWFIRHRLGDAALQARDDAITLAVSLDCDRDQFLQALEAGDECGAVQLYLGDFLPGFAAPGGAEFEQWADLERYRLRHAFIRAAETAIQKCLRLARFRDAQALARRVRDADPAREAAWRLLIEAHLSANDKTSAGLEADALEQTLAADRREPETATRKLLARVREAPYGAPEGGPGRTLVAELTGREQPFSRLVAAALRALKGPPGGHVHVMAPAGLGKTRLLLEFQNRLRATGMRAIYVRANPGSRVVPYAFAADAAAGLAPLPGARGVSQGAAGALVALNPSLSSTYSAASDTATGDDALRRRVIALRELLEAVADEEPVALLMDDIHWADAHSRQILTALVANLHRTRALIVTSARPSPEGAIATGESERLALPPLPVHDVSVLVSSLAELPQTPWADRLPATLHAVTGGSPLFVLETLRLLMERGTLRLGSQGWECSRPDALMAQLQAGSALMHRVTELDATDRQLLLLLALAGAPMSTSAVAEAAEADQAATRSRLDALEQRGLVDRPTGEWEPGHDETATLTMELASPEALLEAHAALGHALAVAAEDDAQALLRAGRHLAAAGTLMELKGVYRRWVVLARRRGTRGSHRRLARELAGPWQTPALVREMLASLPLRLRLGLETPARMAAAVLGLAALGLAGAALVKPLSPRPDIHLILINPGRPDGISAVAVPLRRDYWRPADAIRVGHVGRPYSVLRAASRGANYPAPDLALSPDGWTWAFSRFVSDSAGIKLFVLRDGRARQVTDGERDDANPDWSPDGRAIVFSTERWNPNRWTDLAILELATGRLRQLTAGDDADGVPRWSPDGSRIAFERWSRSGTRAVCWITTDGHHSDCLPFVALHAWYDAGRVIAAFDSGGVGRLVKVELERRRMEEVTVLRGPTSVSPDGRWAACYCAEPEYAARRWSVFPIDRPEEARHLTDMAQPSATAVAWLLAPHEPAFLDTLDIVAPTDSPRLGASYRLRARGANSRGQEVGVPTLHWSSDDSALATVDPITGLLTPRRPGIVSVAVSAGGWRDAGRSLVIRPARYEPALHEDWTIGIGAQWVPFGDPLPTIVADGGGRPAFWNRGDGWFYSGVYSRPWFDAHDGLGIEVELSTPLLGPRQQFARVLLGTWEDSALVGRWDHRAGMFPHLDATCGAQYPPGGGDRQSDRDAIGFDDVVTPLPRGVGHELASGRWFVMTIQLFPDGRCGLALNGKPLLETQQAIAVARPFKAMLYGNSLGTRILVRRVSVWSGVRPDIPWAVVEARRVRD